MVHGPASGERVDRRLHREIRLGQDQLGLLSKRAYGPGEFGNVTHLPIIEIEAFDKLSLVVAIAEELTAKMRAMASGIQCVEEYTLECWLYPEYSH